MTSSAVLILTILLSSFLGSWHCAGMCSPVAAVMTQKNKLHAYHIGRLLSYTTLGILAGSLGQFFLSNSFLQVRWIAAFFLASALVASGISILLPDLLPRLPIANLVFMTIKKLQKFHLNHSPLIVGALTAFLPCGWLYTYVTAAIATQSPWTGGLTMFLFWLGTLPALSAIPFMIKNLVAASNRKQQKIAGCILVAAGLYSIASFMLI